MNEFTQGLVKRETLVQVLIARLIPFADGVAPMDFPRIEELCWLIREAMRPENEFTGAPPLFPATRKPANTAN